MNQEKTINHECVEAVPGPPIVISKETYIKMQESNSAQQNKERLESCRKFFKGIKRETQSQEEESTF